jgi:hypothetical protein
MSGLLFARGRVNETALSEVTAAGATSIAVTDADQLFSTGDMLLISEADGGETQWLGKVTAVDAASVAFSRPPAQSKNTGALLWRAEFTLETPSEETPPQARTIDGGVATERTRDGQWLAVQVAEPGERWTLSLEGLTPATERAVVNWLAAQAGWGLHPFTLIRPDGSLLVARLNTGPGDGVRRDRRPGGRAKLTLPLWIVAEGAYQ